MKRRRATLFSTDPNASTAATGFHKVVEASVVAGGDLVVASYAFDSDGYDREQKLTVQKQDLGLLSESLGLRSRKPKAILKELQLRFATRTAEDDFLHFLADNKIGVDQQSYTSR